MKIDNDYIGLELAKKLKELGIKFPGYHVFVFESDWDYEADTVNIPELSITIPESDWLLQLYFPPIDFVTQIIDITWLVKGGSILLITWGRIIIL